mmetsp:Transcript_37978/g.80422  ORF Transcript_37978/g.80422 Transcript_37978/m.80422 type:complete len:266 (-) Transcript_37978:403-1200(-)
MDDAGTTLSGGLNLLRRKPVHVHRNEALVEKTQALQVLHGRAELGAHVAGLGLLVAGFARLHLLLHFVEVDVQRHLQLLGEGAALGDCGIRAGVGGMQRDSKGEPLRFLVLFCQLLSLCKVLIRAAAIAPKWEFDGDHADRCSNACLLNGLANSFWEPVHVVEGGDATLNHLQDRQFSPLANELFVAELELQWPNCLLKPLPQGDVICDTAEEDHGGMGVRVHEARHECCVLEHGGLLPLVLLLGLVNGQDVQNFPSINHNTVVR